MLWIKRNLLLVVGIAIAVALMSLSGYYLWDRWNVYDQNTTQLETLTQSMQELLKMEPFPNQQNIAVVKDSTKMLRKYMADASALLTAPQYEKLNTEKFQSLLSQTIAELGREATNASVTIPPKYGFTFGEIRTKMNLVPYGIEPMTIQLQEIKTICTNLFDSRIHQLETLQRVPVSTDDPASSSDYLKTSGIVTNGFYVMTPYLVSFRCFTAELTSVLNRLSGAKDYLVVKNIDIQTQDTGQVADTSGPGGGTGGMAGGAPGTPGGQPPPPKGMRPGVTPPPPKPKVIVDEKPLKVTLLIEIIKPYKGPPAPKPAAAPQSPPGTTAAPANPGQ